MDALPSGAMPRPGGLSKQKEIEAPEPVYDARSSYVGLIQQCSNPGVRTRLAGLRASAGLPHASTTDRPWDTTTSSPIRQAQRRLSSVVADEMTHAYVEGHSIDELAQKYGVNRTTVISHLDKRGIERRRVVRKMTDELVRDAAADYESGASLAVVARRFEIDGRTLGREFRKAGVEVRPRRGWASSDGSADVLSE